MVVYKEIIYYTDNEIDDHIAKLCKDSLSKSGLNIVSSSLKPMKFGSNKVMDRKRGYLTLFMQIVDCLERSEAEYVFFCEHDVIYSKEHFDFKPTKKDVYYYNNNVWKWNGEKAVSYDSRWLSQLCCSRELALQHYRKKVELERQGIKKRFEPATKRGIDNYKSEIWESEIPNVDIRHGKNLTGVSRFKVEDFRSKPKNFKELNYIPHYGTINLDS